MTVIHAKARFTETRRETAGQRLIAYGRRFTRSLANPPAWAVWGFFMGLIPWAVWIGLFKLAMGA